MSWHGIAAGALAMAFGLVVFYGEQLEARVSRWRAGRCRKLLKQPRCEHMRVRELCDECRGAA